MLKRFVHLGGCGLGLVLLVSGGQEVLSEVLPKAIAQEKEQEQTQAIEHETPLEDPALEQQAQKLFRDLRCLVCEAEALASSPAPFARELRQAVRKKLAQGADEKQIHLWLRRSYGEAIFLTPAFTSATVFLWLAPFALFGVGLACWLVALRSGQARSKPRHSDTPQ